MSIAPRTRLLVIVMLSAFVTGGVQIPPVGPPEARVLDRPPVVRQPGVVCDSDGVSASFVVAYRADAPAGYHLTAVEVGGIAAACEAGAISVSVLGSAGPMASGGPVPVESSVARMELDGPAGAADVVTLSVEIAR